VLRVQMFICGLKIDGSSRLAAWRITTSDRAPSLPAIGLPQVGQKPRSIRVFRSDVTAW
jgi:hypothetical protein